jgi:hypothetical protein
LNEAAPRRGVLRAATFGCAVEAEDG